ncbi:MAG: beta-propeller fold lactonase family protein [Leptospirales bacterium]|nr:beta-propeller fold lactonase family protein [Leptospirales bacterium]
MSVLFSRVLVSRFLYVPSQGTNYVTAFSIDRSSGRLSQIQTIGSFPGTPNGSCLDPDRNYYFVGEQTGTGPIHPFAIDQRTGMLSIRTPLTQSFGSNPQSCVVVGSTVYVAVSIATNNVFLHSITSSGTLQAMGLVSTGALGLSESSAEPAGEFVYFSDSGNSVFVFRVGANGALTAGTGSPLVLAGAPSSLSFSGNRVYVANGSGNVAGYTRASNGQLTLIAGSSQATGAAPTNTAIDPGGRFLYVVNNGGASLSGYVISSSGTLTPVSGSPFATSANPNGIAMDAGGQYVYVSHASGTVGVFAINQSTGQLTNTQSISGGSTPTDVAIVNVMVNSYLGGLD